MNNRIFSHFRLIVGWVAFFWAGAALAQSTLTLTAGTQGTAYSHQINGAPAGTIYSATGLPSGLNVNSTSGLISGTPNASGTFTGTLSLVSGTITNNFSYSLVINPPAGTPVVSSGASASGTVGTANATIYTITASNTPTSYNATGLPPGLTLNGTTGVIGGTPSAAGSYVATVSANNATGTGTGRTVTFTIAAPATAPVISAPATITVAAAGTAVTSTQIVATGSPTSYSASGLPAGLSLDTVNGVISGTPVAGGSTTVTLRATNAGGTSAAFTLTVTVGTLSNISSSLTASATAGSAFTYAVTGSGSGASAPTSFTIGTLPAGLSIGGTASAPTITGTPSTAGTCSITLAANNVNGAGASSTLVLTVAPAATGGGGGGSGGGGGGGGGGGIIIGGGSTVAAPTITTQPASQSVTRGGSVTFSVSATSTGLSYHWAKDGVLFANGGRESSLTLNNLQDSDAGNYTVFVSNSGGSVTSAVATLTVLPPSAVATAPVITTQPASQSVAPGTTVTLVVAATGTAPLTYQWRKDGTAIAGATSAALSLAGVTANSAGAYSVVVSNSAGSVTSATATLAITRSFAGAYFGTFGGNGGTFAVFLRENRTGVFIGYASASRTALVATNVTVTANGAFSATVPAPVATTGAAGTPPIAAHEGEYHIEGSIGATGALSGTVSTLNLTLAAPAPSTSGSTAALAGFYPAGAAGSSASSYTVIGAAGEAFVLTTSGTTVDAGRGTIDASGNVAVTTAANANLTGSATAAGFSLRAGTVTFAGRNADAAVDNEKLVNISTRSQAGTGGNVMIAGFVITGAQPKSVLVRGIGPTLATLGVGNALSAVRLEIFRDQTSVAVGNDWGAAPNAATLAATAARVGAFALPAGSRDAALLLNLAPGSYTAIVSGQGTATGVALVEAYDATTAPIPNAERIINISTRATAGAGENALIAGFYVSGTVPKRVLIRGVGPALNQFGLTGTLAQPQLTLFSGSNSIATNAGWSTSPDAAAIAAASARVGAFTLAAGSRDAAVIVNLAPGAYSAQVTGVNATSGLALVEVYELP